LLNLAPHIRKLFAADQLDRQQAMELARLPTHAAQDRILALINRGRLVGWKAVRNAVDAVIGADDQGDMFPKGKPSQADVKTLAGMEARIAKVQAMVAEGWKNGECVVAARVNLNRTALIADRIANINKALRVMERELRNVAAQREIIK
jgi:hypothetical protein